MKKNLAYFEDWTDPIALQILNASTTSTSIAVHRLRYSSQVEQNMETMRAMHGYQIATRGNLQAPWFGDARLLENCPNLLAITSTGSGYDMIDVDACTHAGVIVCNQTGSNANAVAEHTLGLMLSLSKKIVEIDRALRVSTAHDRFLYRPNDLRDKTIGLVGIGEIGTRVAASCNAFGMKVLAYDPLLSHTQIKQRGAEPASFEIILANSDFVSLHCPRNEATLGMFGAEQFRLMKRSAWFISTARGGIHDEGALHAALVAGVIGGAGLDVFSVEPPSADHPLLKLENVVATHHIAGLSVDALRSMATYAATQWRDIFAGKVPPRLVNPEVWDAYSRRFVDAFGWKPDALS